MIEIPARWCISGRIYDAKSMVQCGSEVRNELLNGDGGGIFHFNFSRCTPVAVDPTFFFFQNLSK